MCSKVALARKEGLIVTTINGMIMNKRLWTSLALTLAVSTPNIVYASIDVDVDNDGLIEIATLEQLDLMRNDLAGTSLDGDSTGCPLTGCHGYELVADLDFDTNGNGMADAGDAFWNNGLGWDPVGPNETHATSQKDTTGAVTADFNGNGFVISNMYIDRPTKAWTGLFSNMSNNAISNLVFINAQVEGENATGVLSGGLNNTHVHSVRISDSTVSGLEEVGLLGGRFWGSGDTIEHINVEGQVSGEKTSGGVIGVIVADNANTTNSPIIINDVTSDVAVNILYGTGGCIAGAAHAVVSTNITGICDHVIGSGLYMGGIYGYLTYGSLDNIYSKSAVSSGNSTYVGGIVGNMSYSSMNKAYTSSESEVSGSHPGGLIGYTRYSTISNSASHGSVLGGYYASGLIMTGKGVTLENVYSTSPLQTQYGNFDGRRGLIVSNTASTVINSYWDIEATGATISADGLGEGKSSAVLKCPTIVGDTSCDTSVYENWNGSIWDFSTSSDYPVLR